MIDTAVDLPVCTSTQDIQEATARDAQLQELKVYIIKGWLHKIICGTRYTKILAHQPCKGYDRWHGYKKQVSINTISAADADTETATQQPQGIEKTRLLAHELVNWVNMNADIESVVEHCSTCLEDQNTLPQKNTTPCVVPAKLWEVDGTDIFMINNKNVF